jgi:hypothetical protein
MLGWHGPGTCRTQATFTGLQPSPTSTTGRAVLPDGLATRPRHDTRPVKRAVPGLVARWAYRARLGPSPNKI